MAKPKKLSEYSALLIIDVQKGFDYSYWGKRNNLRAEENMARLLSAFRKAKKHIYHVKHNSINAKSLLRPGQIGNKIKDLVNPFKNEILFEKQVNSAFIGTKLEEQLRKDNIKQLIIVGLTTDHCVSTTARMAGNLGFKVYVIADATATFDRKSYNGKYYTADEMHESALASLNNEFAAIVTTQQLLELL